jgi:diguanylate cyclase (GGDEF)-like protein
MTRTELVTFFERESGRSYDPGLVKILLASLDEIDAAQARVEIAAIDLWSDEGAADAELPRTLARVDPTITYSQTLDADTHFQSQLYSAAAFANSTTQFTEPDAILDFMGARLAKSVSFDAAVFYLADLESGTVKSKHAIGRDQECVRDTSVRLEQKLTGWVAANNQPLNNLPPFPDFVSSPEPRPAFEMSSIAPLNEGGTVLGAIALYRRTKTLFTDADFRKLELLARQTSIALSKCGGIRDGDSPLIDLLTNLPNFEYINLIFDLLCKDAARFGYSLSVAIIAFQALEPGRTVTSEGLRDFAKRIKARGREVDLVMKYRYDKLVTVLPRMNAALSSRFLEQIKEIKAEWDSAALENERLSVTFGIASFPVDGTTFEELLEVAERRRQNQLAPFTQRPHANEDT